MVEKGFRLTEVNFFSKPHFDKMSMEFIYKYHIKNVLF